LIVVPKLQLSASKQKISKTPTDSTQKDVADTMRNFPAPKQVFGHDHDHVNPLPQVMDKDINAIRKGQEHYIAGKIRRKQKDEKRTGTTLQPKTQTPAPRRLPTLNNTK